MSNRGFGGISGADIPGASGNFEQMARQYWTAWEQALRGAAPAALPPSAGAIWQDALHAWTDAFTQRSPNSKVMARFGQQARQWYAQIQQVAAQLGGHNSRPVDVVDAWRAALGGSEANLFQNLFDSMNGPGMQGMEQWLRGVQPVLDALKGEGSKWTDIPAFGCTREHQERLQALTAAQLEVHQASQAYQALLVSASQAAFQHFEQRLSTLAAEGRSIDTPRALFDLWVDAAEDAYAQMALSESYRHAYGHLLNAQIRLRAGIQREVEHFCTQLGMPTRTELDGAHRKIIELERELRRMRDRSESRAESATAAKPSPHPGPVKPAQSTAGTTKPAKQIKPTKPAKKAAAESAPKAVKKTSRARRKPVMN